MGFFESMELASYIYEFLDDAEYELKPTDNDEMVEGGLFKIIDGEIVNYESMMDIVYGDEFQKWYKYKYKFEFWKIKINIWLEKIKKGIFK